MRRDIQRVVGILEVINRRAARAVMKGETYIRVELWEIGALAREATDILERATPWYRRLFK